MNPVIRSVAAPFALAFAAFVSAGPVNASVGWSIQPTQNPTVNALLNGVSCSSPKACTAVGAYQTGSGALKTLAERWDGSKWRRQPTPNPSGLSPQFAAVSCPRARNCVAVGSTGDGLRTLAEGWNGSKWKIQASGTDRSGWLTGVSCPSPNACTAVGFTGFNGTLAERWNGIKWVVQHTRSPADNSGLTGVSCPTATDCTAVGFTGTGGGTFAEQWIGGKWVLQATRSPTGFSFLDGVSCSSSSACTATGYYEETTAGTYKTLVERWNGRTWRLQTTPKSTTGIGVDLAGVSCPKSSLCIATGYYETSQGQRVLAERWNGSVWKFQRAPNPTGTFASQLNGVSCPSSTDCEAAGFARISFSQKTLAERYRS